MNTKRLTGVAIVAAGLLACGCDSMYYGTWEKLGVHKRDILVDRVEDARDGQEQAKQTFADALEQFQSVVDYEGGNLQALYDRLKGDLADCEARAGNVTQRIDSVQAVAEALFAEWEQELDDYASDDLRRRSAEQLRQTKQSYGKLLAAMRRAEAKMEPVLTVFRDQVLFLKHNLNARALASLEGVVMELDKDVAALIAEMQTSIDEANAFIETLE